MSRTLSIFALILPVLLAGCPKSSALPKDLRDYGKNVGVGTPGGPVVAPLPPPQPLSADQNTLPPKSDPQAKVPALPGVPGSPSRPMEPVATTRQIIAGAMPEEDEETEDRLIERLRKLREANQKKREERKEKDKPELPPATEKDKKDAPPAPPAAPKPPEAPPIDPMPVMPPMGAAIPAPAPAPKPTIDMREVVKAAAKKYETIPDYEARLTKRETVKGKALPGEEMTFKFRKEPYSVYMNVTSDNGKGREILYVKGQNNGKLALITGKGDSPLVGAGARFNFDPEDPMASSKTRNKITNGGMGRTLGVLTKFFEDDASGKRPANTIRSLGEVERNEYAKPMLGLEVTLVPGDDPNLPKGGKRKYFFDNDAASASYGFPVLIMTTENDKEVEYYCFDHFKMPANLTDADFSAEKLGKKK